LAFSAKKKDANTDKKIFCVSFEFDFFRVQLKFAFRMQPLVFGAGFGFGVNFFDSAHLW